MNKVLIIDDEKQLRELLARIIHLEGYEVFQADSCASGLRLLEKTKPQLVLCDVKLPDGNGVELLEILKKKSPYTQVILLTAYGNIPDGVQAIKNGAFNYLVKGDDNNRIIPLISSAMEKANKQMADFNILPDKLLSFEQIIGSSNSMKQAMELAIKVAKTDTSVLLTGETGTGKEVFAHAIHSTSNRKDENFVAINCSAFTKDLLESELFGHKAGAFTVAISDKKGLIELSNKGTLFLDEIGEMPIEMQAKLLRVIENKEFIKVGESKASKVDMRIIAATNRNLEKEIIEGHFREDLYYRLSVFNIQLPPLRERIADIEEYANYFVKLFNNKMNKNIIKIDKDYLLLLKNHSWHGNVRELRNVIERSMILCDGDSLLAKHLPLSLIQNDKLNSSTLPTSLESIEKEHILKTLKYCNGNKTEAARLLDIGIATLYRKISEYNLSF